MYPYDVRKQPAEDHHGVTREGARLYIKFLKQQAIEVDPGIEEEEDGSKEKDEDGLVKRRQR